MLIGIAVFVCLFIAYYVRYKRIKQSERDRERFAEEYSYYTRVIKSEESYLKIQEDILRSARKRAFEERLSYGDMRRATMLEIQEQTASIQKTSARLEEARRKRDEARSKMQ